MNIVRGWAFPDADRFMVQELQCDGTYQLGHLQAALRHVRHFGCAIDGGAHIGTWTRVLSGVFQRVIAVEPSPDTFGCLEWNLAQAGCTNVTCKPVALGERLGTTALRLDADNEARANTGARFVTPGTEIPVEPIDAWDLTDVGFLKLDVEGSEPFALAGARETIRRCRPIILFEDKRLWTRHFGVPKEAVARRLTSYGYRHLERVSMDEIWGPRA